MAAAKPKTHRNTKPKPKKSAAASKAKAKTEKQPERTSLRREIYGVLVGAVSILLLLSLVSHVPTDAERNWVGKTGNFLAEGVFFLFGVGAFVTVFITGAIAVWLLFGRQRQLRPGGIMGGGLLMLSMAALFSVLLPNVEAWAVPLGGWLGTALGGVVVGVLGRAGAVLILLSTAVIGLILITRSSFVEATTRAVQRVRETTGGLRIGERAGRVWGGIAGVATGIFARKARATAPPLEEADYEDDVHEETFSDDDLPFENTDEILEENWSDTESPSASMRTLQEIADSVEARRAAAQPEVVPAAESAAAAPAAHLAFGERQGNAAPAPSIRARKGRDDFAGEPPVRVEAPVVEESSAAIRAREALERFRRGERAAAPSPGDASLEANTAAASLPTPADADRVRANMHNPIDNPMADTTRQNAAVRGAASAAPSAERFGAAAPPTPPKFGAPSAVADAFAGAAAAGEGGVGDAMARGLRPGVAGLAADTNAATGIALGEEGASPWERNDAPAAPSRNAPPFEMQTPQTPAAPVEMLEPQRLETDIGIEDIEVTEPDEASSDAPPPILRPADEELEDEQDFDDEVGATAPHRIIWPEAPAGAGVRAQERTTRPVDPLEDADFEPERLDEPVASSAPTPRQQASPQFGPQIIESPAQKERMTCEAMDRALRAIASERANSSWVYPTLDALTYEESSAEIDEDGLREMAAQLVEALADYKVKGRVTGICPGPVVTRFEFEPEAGTKLSRISGLSTDIAMRLRAENVRIIAPIPGKGCVGVEVPNDIRETVYLKEILADRRFVEARSKLTMALGKDIEGFPVVADLAKMPHLLVAGTTGSGKSVSVNAMIMSVLFNASPDEVRLILIDPKQLEFALYEDVPHLLLPVVTDPMKAATALQWAVDDMERRYRLMKELRVRNIEGYNQKIKQLQEELKNEQAGRGKASSFAVRTLSEEDMDGRPRHRHMPYIIVVVDEFADLMMAAGKDVEIAVARIAQKARAAGIHCILATQRPSVDVLTGTIKSNFPTRISFRLITGTDSRTVLDTQGAENLLGMGDMLYRPPGSSDLLRVHGAFIDEDEIERVVDFLKDQREVEYDETILAAQVSAMDDDEELDPKFEEAIDVCVEAGFASISMIQRRLSIGYNRAANIMEEMERRGIVGPSSGGASRREVLITR